jgi:hypothetical protein
LFFQHEKRFFLLSKTLLPSESEPRFRGATRIILHGTKFPSRRGGVVETRNEGRRPATDARSDAHAWSEVLRSAEKIPKLPQRPPARAPAQPRGNARLLRPASLTCRATKRGGTQQMASQPSRAPCAARAAVAPTTASRNLPGRR